MTASVVASFPYGLVGFLSPEESLRQQTCFDGQPREGMPVSEEPTRVGEKLPNDSATLILDWMPEHYKQPSPSPTDMLTEDGRMRYAVKYAEWDFCIRLKARLENQMKGRQ